MNVVALCLESSLEPSNHKQMLRATVPSVRRAPAGELEKALPFVTESSGPVVESADGHSPDARDESTERGARSGVCVLVLERAARQVLSIESVSEQTGTSVQTSKRIG